MSFGSKKTGAFLPFAGLRDAFLTSAGLAQSFASLAHQLLQFMCSERASEPYEARRLVQLHAVTLQCALACAHYEKGSSGKAMKVTKKNTYAKQEDIGEYPVEYGHNTADIHGAYRCTPAALVTVAAFVAFAHRSGVRTEV